MSQISFYKYYRATKKFVSLSFRSKYTFLSLFLDDMNIFSDLKPPKLKHKKEKIKVFDTDSELYNKFLDKYFDEYYDLEGEEKEELGFKFMPINLNINGNDCNQFYKKISDDDSDSDVFIDISDIPPLEGDEEEVKERKGLKILTPNKLLTRLPILLAQIKGGNNSCNLKNEIRQTLYLLYQHNKIIKKVYNNLIKS